MFTLSHTKWCDLNITVKRFKSCSIDILLGLIKAGLVVQSTAHRNNTKIHAFFLIYILLPDYKLTHKTRRIRVTFLQQTEHICFLCFITPQNLFPSVVGVHHLCTKTTYSAGYGAFNFWLFWLLWLLWSRQTRVQYMPANHMLGWQFWQQMNHGMTVTTHNLTRSY